MASENTDVLCTVEQGATPEAVIVALAFITLASEHVRF